MVDDPQPPPPEDKEVRLAQLERQYKAVGVYDLQLLDMSEPLNEDMKARIDRIYDAFRKRDAKGELIPNRNPDGSPINKAFYRQIVQTFKETQEIYLKFHEKAKSYDIASNLIGEPAIYIGDKDYIEKVVKRDEKDQVMYDKQGKEIMEDHILDFPILYTSPTMPGKVVVTQAIMHLAASEGDPLKRRSIIKGAIAHEAGHWLNGSGDRDLKSVSAIKFNPEIRGQILV